MKYNYEMSTIFLLKIQNKNFLMKFMNIALLLFY